MDWAKSEAYLTILLSVLGTGLFAWWRESVARRDRQKREDELDARYNARQDEVAARQLREWAQQQWWDRKYQAYGDLQQAMWFLLERSRDAVDYYNAGHAGDPNPRERNVEFDYAAQLAILRRSADASHLTLSSATVEVTKSVVDLLDWQRYHETTGPDDEADTRLAALERAVAVVKAEAIRDLSFSTSEPN